MLLRSHCKLPADHVQLLLDILPGTGKKSARSDQGPGNLGEMYLLIEATAAIGPGYPPSFHLQQEQ